LNRRDDVRDREGLAGTRDAKARLLGEPDAQARDRESGRTEGTQSRGDPMHRLIVRQVKGAERFVVSLSDGRSAEDRGIAGGVGGGACGEAERRVHWTQQRGPDCPQQHADQDPAQVNPRTADPRRALAPVGV